LPHWQRWQVIPLFPRQLVPSGAGLQVDPFITMHILSHPAQAPGSPGPPLPGGPLALPHWQA
jgi:hypothetical protein